MEDTIVLYPAPGRGHVNSTIEFGKLLLRHYNHHPAAAVTITVVITPLPFETSSPAVDTYLDSVSADHNASITFLRLPLLSPSTYSVGGDFATAIPALFYRLPLLQNPHLRGSLSDLSKSKRVKALVLDFFCNAAVRVADELGIPFYFYFTSCACDLAQFLHFPVTHGASVKGVVDSPVPVPGLPPVPSEDIPPAMADRSCEAYSDFIDTAHNMVRSAGLIVNSFELLEGKAIRAIAEGKCTPGRRPPPVYCVGPVVEEGKGRNCSRRHACLTWLDSQPKGSVVFLCFGSAGVFSRAQITEVAIGLERSGARFLWVVKNLAIGGGRPTTEDDEFDLGSILPSGFLHRTEGRGFLVKRWAPQVEVLNHESVGGFVTHCGWNSVLESLCAGVPMIGWPLYAEQRLNRHFMVEEMGVALELTESEGQIVKAEELEKQVVELMMMVSRSEKGKAVRERVVAVKAGAAVAMSDGGSSRVAVTKLVESFRQC
ncbi:unnamed protein product [Linum tenue]|uniref:Glycosyltransferase n=1 Tax=Linum tenue TaxID=586396 RepID=A0AAV0QLP3_9ROSI|nr:unnamed protein product [Linum tenue]